MNNLQTVKLVLVFVTAYLLGSVDFGIIVSKHMFKDDVRNYGSGNAGTTNMLRTFGLKRAAITVVGDALKGFVGVLIAKEIFKAAPLIAVKGFFTPPVMREIAVYTAVLAAVIGHMYPLFFKFKGGKGVATGFGGMLRASPVVSLLAISVFAVIALTTKIVSLASVTACVSFFVFTLAIQLYTHTFGASNAVIQLIAAFVLPSLVIYAHRGNIKRLLNGTEYKFGRDKNQ